MHICYHYRFDTLYMSYARCEWGNTLTFFDIPDNITSVITPRIHSSCRSYGMDFEPWLDGDGT